MLMITVAFVPAAAGGSGGASGDGSDGDGASTGAVPSSPLDLDGNGLDERLDRKIASGHDGTVYLHVHYDRRPTEEDAARLESSYGALRTYVFRNWDDVKAEAHVADVTAMLDAPGVVGIDEYVPPVVENNVGPRAIRARQGFGGEPVVEGIDHSLSVHETLGLRGEGMVIAVLDTGVDNTHPSLDDLDDDPATDDPKLVQRTDPTTGLTLMAAADASSGFGVVGCVDPQDDDGHGTHVAGTALGTGGSSRTFQGVAPQARLVDIDIAIPLGVTAVGLGQDIAADWLISYNKGETCYGDPGDDAVDVATMSFGSGGDDPDDSGFLGTGLLAFNRPINRMVMSGITHTTSAGNSGPGSSSLTTGADATIIVASDNDRGSVARNDDCLSDFSSRGPRSDDLDADSLDELRPDVAAPGQSITSANAFHETGADYVSFSGTSMAAPHVAGTAALILQANPTLRPVADDLTFGDYGSEQRMGEAGRVPVRDVLQRTAQPKTSPCDATAMQFEQTGKFGRPWNNGYGYGLIDAYAAVKLAQDLLTGGLAADAGGPYVGTSGTAVSFFGDATGGTPPYTFDWSFGDGDTLTDGGPDPTHTYAADGTYDVVLDVTDAEGNTTQATTTACIGAGCAVFAITDPKPGEALVGGEVTVAGTHTLGASGGTNALSFDDPQGDATVGFGGDLQTPVPNPLPYADVVEGTVAEAGDDLVLTIEVDDLSDAMTENAHATYYFNFEAGAVSCPTETGSTPSSSFFATASIRNSVAGGLTNFEPSFRYGCINNLRRGLGPISGTVDTAADTITFTVPKADVGDPADGSTIGALEILAQGCICGPSDVVGGITPTYDTASTGDVLTLGGGQATGGSVEVAVDDPTFDPAGQLAVTTDVAAGTWEATWDISDLSGQHTVFARQLDDTGAVTAEEDVTVLLNGGGTPTVTIVDPADGGTVPPQVIEISGTASTGGGGGGGDNAAPTATLGADVTSGDAPLDVVFTLTADDPDGADDLASWSLDFGDGSPPATGTGDPTGTAEPHTYSDAGSYTAELCVVDAAAAEDCDAVPVQVDAVVDPPGVTTLYLHGDTVVGNVDRYSDTLDLGVGELVMDETPPGATFLPDAWTYTGQAQGTGSCNNIHDVIWDHPNPVTLDDDVVEVIFYASAYGAPLTGTFQVFLYAGNGDPSTDCQTPAATGTASVTELPVNGPTEVRVTMEGVSLEATTDLWLGFETSFDAEDSAYSIHYDGVQVPSRVRLMEAASGAETLIPYSPVAYNWVEGVGGVATRAFVAGNAIRPSARFIELPAGASAGDLTTDIAILGPEPGKEVLHTYEDLALTADGADWRSDGEPPFVIPDGAPNGDWEVRFTVSDDAGTATTRSTVVHVRGTPTSPDVASEAEIDDGPDGTPAPPQADIQAVDFSHDATHLIMTMELADLVVPAAPGDAPADAHAVWWDVSFTAKTDYIAEFTAFGGATDCLLWEFDPDGGTGGGGAWTSANSPPGFACSYSDATDTITLRAPLDHIGRLDADGQPTGVVTNTWAATWPNAVLAYTVPFDAAPADDSDLADGPFGDDYVLEEDDGDTLPPVFDGLRSAVPGDRQVELGWDPASDDQPGTIMYEVYAALDPADVFDPASKVDETTSTAYTATGLVNGETYHFGVRARDAAGNVDANTVTLSATPTSTGGDDPRVEVRVAGGDWRTATGVQQWSIHEDMAPFAGQTVPIEARHFDGSSFSAIDQVEVDVLSSTGLPFVTVDAPSPDGAHERPITFEGTFSTDGSQPPEAATVLDPADVLPLGTRAWLASPFVEAVLASPDWPADRADLAAVEGFSAALPDPRDGGRILVLLEGDVPADAPLSTPGGGWPVAYVEDAPMAPLERVAGPGDAPERVLTLDEFEEWAAGDAPDGPILPSVQQGAGPGTAIQMRECCDMFGNIATFICTASFLLEDVETGRYYLSTAGHCLLDDGNAQGRASDWNGPTDPGGLARWVQICVADCLSNAASAGTYVRINPGDDGIVHPVTYAQQGGIGRDFGMIEIPESLQEHLRPWMWFWRGPTRVHTYQVGDPAAIYGHGVELGVLFPTQGRAGVISFASGDHSQGYDVLFDTAGGDSGSATTSLAPRTGERVLGDGAGGIHTHGVIVPGIPLASGTKYNHALSQLRSITGLDLQLVTEDAEIGGDEQETIGTTIDTPLADQVFDLANGAEVPIAGTGSFLDGDVGPGTGEQTWYLHRTDCGGDDVLFMDTDLGPEAAGKNGGDGCGNFLHPITGAWEAVFGEPLFVDDYPAQSAPAADVLIDPTRTIEATLVASSTASLGDTGTTHPGSVVTDIELRLLMNGGATVVGTDRVEDATILESRTEIAFSLEPQVDRIPAGADLTMQVLLHQATGPVHVHVGPPTPTSSFDIPLGSPLDAPAVEVAVDDDTFDPANQVAVTSGPDADGDWTAAWDLGTSPLATEGFHTLYARAIQGSLVQDPPASVRIELVESETVPPTADFGFAADGLEVQFTDQSTAGTNPIASWAWDFDGDGTTDATVQGPVHTFPAAGDHDVRLTVADADGNDDAIVKTVTVSEAASWQVRFRLLDEAGGEAVGWTTVATPSTGDAGDWDHLWDPATTPPPGTYTAHAEILEDGVVRDTDSLDVLVNAAPTAVLDADPALADLATPVTLDGAGSSDPDGTIVEYRFDPGDGSGVVVTTQSSIDHVYDAPGDYTASLVVVDDLDTASDPATAAVTAFNEDPVAAIDAPASADSDTPVPFDGSASVDPDGSIASYAWDMGDGTMKTGQQVTHSYDLSGTYDVVLTVEDQFGAQGSALHTIDVLNAAPDADLQVVPASDLTFTERTLDASGSTDPDGTIAEYRFDPGDGSPVVVTAASSIAHTYEDKGTFIASVRVADNGGALSAKATFEVEVLNRPPEMDPVPDQEVEEMRTLTFTVDASDPEGDALTFSASNLPEGASFDPGAREFTWRPDSTQAAGSPYEVTFTVDDGQATDQATAAITVIDVPRAARGSNGLDYQTVQEALDDALPGELVRVVPGTHAEDLVMPRPDVTLCGSDMAALICVDGTSDVVLTPDAGATAITVAVGATDVIVRGVTIQDADVGLRTRAPGTGLRDNVLASLSDGVVIEEPGGGAPSPDGFIMRDNRCELSTPVCVSFAGGAAGLTADARLNDWAVYLDPLVESRVEEGANTILQKPYQGP